MIVSKMLWSQNCSVSAGVNGHVGNFVVIKLYLKWDVAITGTKKMHFLEWWPWKNVSKDKYHLVNNFV